MDLKRNSVISLHVFSWKITTSDCSWVQNLKVNKICVYRIITPYNDTGSIAKRHGCGHAKTATSRQMGQKAKMQLERNPYRRAGQMAK